MTGTEEGSKNKMLLENEAFEIKPGIFYLMLKYWYWRFGGAVVKLC